MMASVLQVAVRLGIGSMRVPAAGPATGDEPHLVVHEPLADPRHNGVREQPVVFPLAGEVQAEFIAGVHMWQRGRARVQDQRRVDDGNTWPTPVPIGEVDGVSLTFRGWLGPKSAVQIAEANRALCL